MSDQNMQELYRMQEDAKKRVMDMRSRSRFAAEQMNRAFGNPPPKEEPRPAPPPPPPVPGGKPEPPRPAPPSPPARESGKREMSGEELERLFILSLCLLLAHEEADQSVLLGLMYLLT